MFSSSFSSELLSLISFSADSYSISEPEIGITIGNLDIPRSISEPEDKEDVKTEVLIVKYVSGVAISSSSDDDNSSFSSIFGCFVALGQIFVFFA